MIRKNPARHLLTCLTMLAMVCLLLAPGLARAVQPEAAPATITTETATPSDDAAQTPAETSGDSSASASSIATDEPEELSPYLLFLGRAHQLVNHFPIALLIVALLIEMIALLRKQRIPSTAGLVCFSIGAVSAGVAAWFGWINATEASPSTTLEIHRWLGVTTASLAGAMLLIALITKTTSWKAGARVYGLGVFACAAIVGVTGHFGGAMIYGHTYLIEVFMEDKPVELASDTIDFDNSAQEPAIRVIDFETHIKPIFETTCYKCHGQRRRRGDLRLDDYKYVFDRDPDEWVIIPGNPDESELIRLISLPQSNKEHMPYKKTVLPQVEIERIRLWILEGAIWNGYDPGRALEQIAQAENPEPAGQQVQVPSISPEQRATILTALDGKGVLAFPVAENTTSLDVNASLLGSAFADADLALLNGLETSVESLNLAGTGVTDAASAALAKYTQLHRLYLQNTQVGDDTLVHVGELANLEYLNLYGTQVTDAGLVHLASLGKLRQIYLWQTGVTSEGATTLRNAIPGIEVDLGEYETVTIATEEETADAEKPIADAEKAIAEAEEMPECCSTAIADGKVCDHTCCVAAAVKGEVCQVCLDGE